MRIGGVRSQRSICSPAGADRRGSRLPRDRAGRRPHARAAGAGSVKLGSFVPGTRERIAGYVYGTIVALAAVTAGASAYEHDLWRLAAIVGISVLILWVAHMYAHGLGESLMLGRRLTGSEFTSIAGRELSIAFAAVLPLAAIVLGALGVFDDSHSCVDRARTRCSRTRGAGSALREAGTAWPDRHRRFHRSERRARAADRRGKSDPRALSATQARPRIRPHPALAFGRGWLASPSTPPSGPSGAPPLTRCGTLC